MVLPDIIQALKTPFAILGESLFVLSIVIVLASRVRRSADSGKISRLAGLGAVFALSVTVMVVFQAVQQINNDRVYRAMHAQYTITISVKGKVETINTSEPVMFRSSSGQVNVGCNDRQSTNAVWSPPEGATEIQAAASWENTDNVKGLAQNVTIQAQTVVASGAIAGLDRNFFGNCPGGGHGELVLRGTYRITRTESHGAQILKTVSDKVNRFQPFVVAMPEQPGTAPESCEITISEGARQVTRLINLKVDAAGKVVISEERIEHVVGDPIPATVAIEGGHLILRIE